MPFFELQHTDKNSRARLGVIKTDHGDIETPIFMPVGTQATVKTLDQTDLKNIGAQIILGNTYHLHLRPGEDLIASQGGLHKFMNWNKPILTDSGGFQVFSLGEQKSSKHKNIKTQEQTSADSQGRLVKIDEDGVTFKSYIDGSTHRFTPEIAIEIQHKLGADIIMAFDECTPDTASEEYVREAMERTHRWAERSLIMHQKIEIRNSKLGSDAPISSFRFPISYNRFLFGIIQGANYKHLREESAQFISNLDFDGIAIGGESIGYNMEATANILDWVYPLIPKNKPHYAMGIGLSPLDLIIAVEHGVDMFDCVGPTRIARHGMVFVRDKQNNHRLNLTRSQHKNDTAPIDEACDCITCKNYSRSYLHHLFAAQEISAMRLATIHNLHFLLRLMQEVRQAIQADAFAQLKEKWI